MKITILIILACLVLISCSKKEKKIQSIEINDINFTIIDSLTFYDENEKIGFVNIISKNKDGKFLFNDIMQQKIFVFDERQEFFSTIGKSGSGPSEFNQILSFTTFNDTVVVYDQSLDKFKFFLQNGSFIKSLSGVTEEKLLAPSFELYINSNEIILPIINPRYSQTPWESSLFASFSLDGKFIRKFGSYSEYLKTVNYFDYTPITEFDNQNKVFYVTYTSAFIIDILGIDGERIKQIKIESDNLKIPNSKMVPTTDRSKTLEQLRSISTPRDLFITKDFLVYYFSNTNEGKDDLYIIIYDRKTLNFITEVKIDSPVRYSSIESNKLILLDSRKSNSLNYLRYEISR